MSDEGNFGFTHGPIQSPSLTLKTSRIQLFVIKFDDDEA